jgi:RNA polymerase sigma-70 factor (ECF subfamily)
LYIQVEGLKGVNDSLDDVEILKGIKSGSTDALEKLMEKYTKYLASVISSIGRTYFNRQDIEEITADCFVSFWRISPGFEMKSDSLKYYLAGTARNISVNTLKSRKIEYLPLEDDIISDGTDIEDDYLKEEAEKNIRECVYSLDEPDRSIFILRYFYFYKTKEIAEKLSINQKSVETRLSRGLGKLKSKLSEGGRK